MIDFGLSRECMIPLRAVRGFEVDPLIGIMGALAGLREGEVGLLQVLFQATRSPWAESMVRAVTGSDGKSFFPDAPEMVAQAREKVAHPLYAVVLRVAAQSRHQGASLGDRESPGRRTHAICESDEQ